MNIMNNGLLEKIVDLGDVNRIFYLLVNLYVSLKYSFVLAVSFQSI